MSYDLHIGNESFNYTYNVAPMWYDCYPNQGIRRHYGMTGAQSVHVLRYLREYMENNRDRLIEMNPENGWGDYDSAVLFVHRLIQAAIRNPDEIWEGD